MQQKKSINLTQEGNSSKIRQKAIPGLKQPLTTDIPMVLRATHFSPSSAKLPRLGSFSIYFVFFS